MALFIRVKPKKTARNAALAQNSHDGGEPPSQATSISGRSETISMTTQAVIGRVRFAASELFIYSSF